MKKTKRFCRGIGLAALVLIGTLAVAEPARAEWIDENKGPGVAQWVDENGNVTEPPTQEASVPEEEKGPHLAGPSQDGASDESQPETQESQDSGRVIDPDRPMIALTFDDGPRPEVGNRIMDCLAQYGGKATFFVVGSRVPGNEAELQRMIAEGHEIGNHSQDHKYFNKLNAQQIRAQVDGCAAAVQAAAGVAPMMVRLPGGNKNATVLAEVTEPIVLWTIDTLDWKTQNAQKTIDAVVGKAKDGDIVLMHELYSASGDAAVQIIPKLVEQGFQLVTVSEMAQYRGGLQSGQVYYDFRP
ncbi:MAG: polysaccharide deacetylase family protein [Lachnospiraceae bacterium]